MLFPDGRVEPLRTLLLLDRVEGPPHSQHAVIVAQGRCLGHPLVLLNAHCVGLSSIWQHWDDIPESLRQILRGWLRRVSDLFSLEVVLVPGMVDDTVTVPDLILIVVPSVVPLETVTERKWKLLMYELTAADLTPLAVRDGDRARHKLLLLHRWITLSQVGLWSYHVMKEGLLGRSDCVPTVNRSWRVAPLVLAPSSVLTLDSGLLDATENRLALGMLNRRRALTVLILFVLERLEQGFMLLIGYTVRDAIVSKVLGCPRCRINLRIHLFDNHF